jgi:hypothetical protein
VFVGIKGAEDHPRAEATVIHPPGENGTDHSSSRQQRWKVLYHSAGILMRSGERRKSALGLTGAFPGPARRLEPNAGSSAS